MVRSCPECHLIFDQESLPLGASPCPGCGLDLSNGSTETTQAATNLETAGLPSAGTDEWVPAAEDGVDAKDLGAVPAVIPARIGRYVVRHRLGRGGFGVVYLADDVVLNRPVAVKVSHRARFTPDQFDRLLAEARVTAGLNHPGIVGVFDFGRTEANDCYLVLEYVNGRSLAELVSADRPGLGPAIDLMIEVADAVHHAHLHGIVHRDLKPSNILLDSNGKPHVADFGLAAHEETLRAMSGERSGTPAYMAPEQVRGEAHRLDSRTDVWSLGVMLYELTAFRKPFSGRGEAIFDEILNHDVRPPRQVDDRIPVGLENVILRCLSKRMADRYPTAADLAVDLRHIRDVSLRASGTAYAPGATAVIPKSLRSFDAEDSSFYLQLLPGPFDRDGLPEAVRFWKARIEDRDPDRALTVGLLFGPSGCGKSSLVKAGILPNLASRHMVAYVDAGSEPTEPRLLRKLHTLFPGLPPELGLTDTLASIRRGDGLPEGERLLIVLDQFEQWLHVNRRADDRELVRALRHCDGQRLQCLVMVRDDFGILAARFMDELEVPIVQGQNFAILDRFDRAHARRVLTKFGRAYGQLDDVLRGEQSQFLERVVDGLAEDSMILPVRLALFAEVVRGKPWVPETLRDSGGTDGIILTFLDQSIGDRATNPDYRRHRKAAWAVLKTLLPESGGKAIKGYRRTHAELLAASGYSARPREFEHLMRVLDQGLRLVTPSDPDGEGSGLDQKGLATGDGLYYQLTHDYLVLALSRWFTRQQRETWRGRAQLCLENRTAQWRPTRETRLLPTAFETLTIALGVPRRDRGLDQWEMLRAAIRHQGLRWGGALAAAVMIGLAVRHFVMADRQRTAKERAETLASAVLSAPADAVPYTLADLRPFWPIARSFLLSRFEVVKDRRQKLHAAYALADRREAPVGFLIDAVGPAPPGECPNLVTALRASTEVALGPLREHVEIESDPAVAARYATILFHLGDPVGVRSVLRQGADPARRTAFVRGFPTWHADLSGLSAELAATSDPDERSGLCVALGLIDREALNSEDLTRLTAALRRLHQSAPDGATHSASGWALAQWSVKEGFPSAVTVAGSGWWVTPLGLTMIRLEPGRFTMGYPSIPGAAPHEVTITRPFALADREVSMAAFRRYYDDRDAIHADLASTHSPDNPVSPGPDYPVQNVSWFDAVYFCNWLSKREGLKPCYEPTGETRQAFDERSREMKVMSLWKCDFLADGYRLPTEAEWEYACRASSATLYSFGDAEETLGDYAVFSRSRAEPCGGKPPNVWGLFDMHGNVREWCWDWSAPIVDGAPVTDPTGAEPTTLRTHRGGSWYDLARACQSPERNNANPANHDNLLGFRVARTVKEKIR